jgi:hypothetical protein
MSKLLLDEYPIVVLPSIAKAVGLNAAVILQQLHYWLQRSANERDGYLWRYQSYRGWAEELGWISAAGVKKIVLKLEKDGLIVSDCFNKMAIDKTKWYRINYDHPILSDKLDDTNSPTIGHKVSVDGIQSIQPEDTKYPTLPETTPETTSKNTPVVVVNNNIAREDLSGDYQSRRMVRDEELSQKRAKAGKKGGNPKLLKNKEVTRDAEILLKQNASKTAYQPPGVPQVNLQYAESFCNRWNEFAKHKCREADLFGISMEIGNVMQRLGLTQFGLDESLENYRQAVTAENSQAKQWSVGRWLREGIDNYRPGYFAMDNYVWDQQNNKNNKTETAAQRRARLEKERNAG